MKMSSSANRKFLPLVCFVVFVVILSLAAVLGIREFQRAKPTTSSAKTMIHIEAPEKMVHTDGAATNFAASPDGSLLIVSLTARAHSEPGIQVLPMATLRGENLDVGSGLQWARVAFAPDGMRFVIGGSWVVPRGDGDPQQWDTPGVLQIWDTKTRSCRQRIVVGDRAVGRIAYDPKGHYVYFTFDGPQGGSVRRLDLKTGTITDVIVPESHVTIPWNGPWHADQLTISPNGRDLVASSTKGTLVWSLHEARERFIAPPSAGATISPDGSQLALAFTNHVKIIDMHTGKRIRELTLDKAIPGIRSVVRFSSDGRVLAAGMNDDPAFPSYLAVWKTTDYSHPVVFPCHKDCILDMRFLPNTHTLVTASADDTLSFWDLDRRHNTKMENEAERFSDPETD